MSAVNWVRPTHVRHSESMEGVPDDAIVLSVGGKHCIDRCRGCGKPLLYESVFSVSADVPGALICGECLKSNEDYASLYDK